MTDKNEKQLIKDLFSRFSNSNKRKIAWEQLYNKYYSILHNYIFTISNDAEICRDIIHDAWIRVLNKQITFKNPLLFKYYLMTTARNTLLNNIRRKKYTTLIEKEAEIADLTTGILETLLEKEKLEYLQELVEDKLRKYDPEKRAILEMYLEGPSRIKDIGEKFKDKYSQGAIYKIIQRFKNDLKNSFKY